MSLSDLEVLVVDCQATAASPAGHLIELGWGRAAEGTSLHTRLVRLPPHVRLPPAVARVTGISAGMLEEGLHAAAAWDALVRDAATLAHQPAPTVAHFARFERPFLSALAGSSLPLDLLCTHEIARRLLPTLPRCGLRALAGYFGRGVGPLRRSGDHVEATAFVWRALVPRLEAEGVCCWPALKAWLARPARAHGRAARAWPMPRDLRLSLPRGPGVYRMLRSSGDVLYVGKAMSLHDRVNSYFRQRHAGDDRLLEMLSQARDVSVVVTPSVLEAALLEADEIKRHGPPYNVALTEETREVWFASRDLSARSPHASPRCPLGPFPSATTLDQVAALLRGSPAALGEGRWAPDAGVFAEGLARFRAAHREWSREDLAPHRRVLRLGARLWREGRRDREDDGAEGRSGARPAGGSWTPERVQRALERVAVRAALAVRRARWLTRLAEASLAWREPAMDHTRLIVVEDGTCTVRAELPHGAPVPVPPGHRRTPSARHEGFAVARFDRLRVLLTELKRLVAEGAPVAVRFGTARAMEGPRLARVLAWL